MYLEKILEITTNWHFIAISHLEADDIMAVASRYYGETNTPVVLVTSDSDMEQCWDYENVKIFSPKSKKWKVKPPKFNSNLFLAKKVEKERSDNLISPILTEEDYNNRMLCVKPINFT